MTTTFALPATTPTPANPAPAFTPIEGTFEAVCATAAVLYELEDLLAALQAADLPYAIVSNHLDAARAAHYAANDAYLAPLCGFPC